MSIVLIIRSYLEFHPGSVEGKGRVVLLLNEDPLLDSLYQDRGGGGHRRYRHVDGFVDSHII